MQAQMKIIQLESKSSKVQTYQKEIDLKDQELA